ncbi:hypothetical protein BHM03_00062601 [Ensete ventricosum]|nr:hypothetical protein BHM03_00062601 [Ensete ventricosum]
MTLHPYIFVSRNKFFLKCNISPKPPWFLMRHSQISGNFHEFPQERIKILKVFSDDDLRSTARDRKKLESLKWQNRNISRVEINVTLMQDDRSLICIEAFPTLHTRLLICQGILVATEFKVWLDTNPRHEREVSPKKLQSLLKPD